MNDIGRVYTDVTPENGAALARRQLVGEVVMLNLLRFREVADYSHFPELAPPQSISGREAYRRYMEHTEPFLKESGGSIVYAGHGGDYLIGPQGEGWDMVLQSDGRIIVAGSARVGGSQQAVVFRLSSSGSLDKFGPEIGGVPQGYNAFRFGNGSTARSIALTGNAELMVAGDAVAANGRSVFFAAKMEMPSLEIFDDGFEFGDASKWSHSVGFL